LIASDHAGFDLKERLKQSFNEIDWVDLGPATDARVDYPDFADALASRLKTDGGRGVLICGSGQGMAIRANRHKGIRAGLVWSRESVQLAREHNDINVLCLGARILDHALCEDLVALFIGTPFAGGRHQERVAKLDR
jgi:ribose 5-phosphate isomerase B